LNILKNGNVKLSDLIEEVRNTNVPSPRTGDVEYDTTFTEGYNAALDDLCRSLTVKMDQAPKPKSKTRRGKGNSK